MEFLTGVILQGKGKARKNQGGGPEMSQLAYLPSQQPSQQNISGRTFPPVSTPCSAKVFAKASRSRLEKTLRGSSIENEKM